MDLPSRRRNRRSSLTLAFSDDSDALVGAGATGRATIVVGGEDDGAAVSIAVYLRLLGWDSKRTGRWPLGELPAAIGSHPLELALPTGLPPACVRLTEYSLCADLRRAGGRAETVAMALDVIGRPEDLYWPDERAGGDGPVVELEADVAAIGGSIAGRVSSGEVLIEVGAALDFAAGSKGAPPRFVAVASTTLAEPGPFRIAIPTGVPPTLRDGDERAVTWRVRATAGGRTSWRTVGVLDPEGTAGRRDGRGRDLLVYLSHLAGD